MQLHTIAHSFFFLSHTRIQDPHAAATIFVIIVVKLGTRRGDEKKVKAEAREGGSSREAAVRSGREESPASYIAYSTISI